MPLRHSWPLVCHFIHIPTLSTQPSGEDQDETIHNCWAFRDLAQMILNTGEKLCSALRIYAKLSLSTSWPEPSFPMHGHESVNLLGEETLHRNSSILIVSLSAVRELYYHRQHQHSNTSWKGHSSPKIHEIHFFFYLSWLFCGEIYLLLKRSAFQYEPSELSVPIKVTSPFGS